jgi:hypothetical protein
VKGTARQAKICRVGLHNGDRRAREPLTELLRAARVQLDGDDARSRPDEWRRERARARTDVDDEVTGSDGGLLDEQLRPVVSEPMPAPTRPLVRGHDAP